MLATRGLSRSFGGVAAVQDVDLTLYAGEIHGLIGPNGAGKSTMLNLLSGLPPPAAGEITLGAERISGRRADQISGMGVPVLSRTSVCSDALRCWTTCCRASSA